MTVDLTGYSRERLEAWRGVCEQTIQEIQDERPQTQEEIAERAEYLASWKQDLDAVNARLSK